MSMEWTDDRIEELRRLWSQGLSASQIADRLGGVSRNAVIGKAHRLGLAKRPSPIKRGANASTAPRAPRRPRAKPTPSPTAAAAAPADSAPTPAPRPALKPRPRRIEAHESTPLEDPVGVLDLTERMCRWPIGHPGDPEFRFCGARTVAGLPYCAAHAQRAYQNVNLDKYAEDEPPLRGAG